METTALKVNTILHTKDGGKIGNAIITARDGDYWIITTAGNMTSYFGCVSACAVIGYVACYRQLLLIIHFKTK